MALYTAVPVTEVIHRGDDVRVRVELPPDFRGLAPEKGSVALHGVSLTVTSASGEDCEVARVLQTLQRTTLGELAPGRRLNLEVDRVARYLERSLVQVLWS